MKRRLLIFSSLITLLLSCFSLPIYAEETVQDSSNLHTLSDGVFLDSYFYENYDLLPYIQNINSNIYLDTGYNASSSLNIKCSISDLIPSSYGTIFRAFSTDLSYGLRYRLDRNGLQFNFDNQIYFYSFYSNSYQLYNFEFDKNYVYLNNHLLNVFNSTEFSSLNSIKIYGLNSNDQIGYFKLYKLSIFDYDADNGNGAYVRYYYPAKSKASGTIGLYDAVSKTFIVSSTSEQFLNPTNDYVENFQISSFLNNSLIWIGQIFDAIIQMPIVIVFIAIGLAGAMFRWGRRIVHF